jgi:hypothetical protein
LPGDKQTAVEEFQKTDTCASSPPALEAAAATVPHDNKVSHHFPGERCNLVPRLPDSQFGDRLKPKFFQTSDPCLEDCAIGLLLLGDYTGECTFSSQQAARF